MCICVYTHTHIHGLLSFTMMPYSSLALYTRFCFPCKGFWENYLLTCHCKSLEDTIMSPTVEEHLFYTIIKLLNGLIIANLFKQMSQIVLNQ